MKRGVHSEAIITYTYDNGGRVLSQTQNTISASVPSVLSGAPSEAWQNLQIERYLPYELTIA